MPNLGLTEAGAHAEWEQVRAHAQRGVPQRELLADQRAHDRHAARLSSVIARVGTWVTGTVCGMPSGEARGDPVIEIDGFTMTFGQTRVVAPGPVDQIFTDSVSGKNSHRPTARQPHPRSARERSG